MASERGLGKGLGKGLGALLGLYVDEGTRDSLPVSSQVTITFRLTGDEAHPFLYLSCERPPLPPQA